jgi:hypothetical protein
LKPLPPSGGTGFKELPLTWIVLLPERLHAIEHTKSWL